MGEYATECHIFNFVEIMFLKIQNSLLATCQGFQALGSMLLSIAFFCSISFHKNYKLTRCVCDTQMPPIMANSKDGQGHKDKYLDTSKKNLVTRIAHVQYESSIKYLLKNNETTEISYQREY